MYTILYSQHEKREEEGACWRVRERESGKCGQSLFRAFFLSFFFFSTSPEAVLPVTDSRGLFLPPDTSDPPPTLLPAAVSGPRDGLA